MVHAVAVAALSCGAYCTLYHLGGVVYAVFIIFFSYGR